MTAHLPVRAEPPSSTTEVLPYPRSTVLNVGLWAAMGLLSLPLFSFAAIGWFSRYAADDYCTASQVVMAGLVQAQSRLYVNWSGRFSATLFNTLLETIGVRGVPFLAGLALVAWVAASAWAIHQLTRAFARRSSPLASAMLAALLVYATLDSTADLPQVVYWQTGLVTYLLPLILTALFVGWLAYCTIAPRPTALALGVPFGLALLAGGTSETFAAAQVTALVLATALAILVRSRLRGMLVAGLVGALVALAIVALAPGNEVRQETSSRTPLLVALPEALDFMRLWLRLTFARPHAVTLALLVLLPGGVAALSPDSGPRLGIRGLVALLAAGALVLLACIFPAYYALGTNPPGRAQLIPQFILMGIVMVLAWCASAWAGGKRLEVRRTPVAAIYAVAILALLVLGPVLSTRQALAELGHASTYAAEWDRLDAQIRGDRNQGLYSVTVPPLPSTGAVQNLDWIGPDRGDWFNQCVAAYYSVSSIEATPGN